MNSLPPPTPEPTVALEVTADEATFLLAYRRTTAWHRATLRFLANYFAGSDDDDDEPPGAIVRLFRRGE